MPKKIAIFDFDGTLFRSPERPTWWPHQGFWGRMETLSPPFVPESPDHDWWITHVVSAAKKSLSDPDTYTVMLTGRAPKFRQRIEHLLRSAGLHFHEVFLGGKGNTVTDKIAVIAALTKRFPEAVTVEMWEDRVEHIPDFTSAIRGMGCEPLIHEVSAPPKEFLNAPEEKTHEAPQPPSA